MKLISIINFIVIIVFSLILNSCSDITSPINPPVNDKLPMWPQHGYNARRTGNPYGSDVYISPVNGISINWIDTIEAGYMYVYPTIDSEGNIYYLHILHNMYSGILYKIDKNGKIIWKFKDSTLLMSWDCGLGLSSDERNIYIPCGSGLYCIDSGGYLKWEYEDYSIYSNVTMPAIGKDGTIYAVIGPYNLCAFTPDGKLKWSVPNSCGAPSLDRDENIYIGWTDGQIGGSGGIAKYDKYGNMKWKYNLAKPPFGCSIDAKNNIYCEFGTGGLQHGFVSLDKDGNLRWEKLRKLGDSIVLAYNCTPTIDKKNNIIASGFWYRHNGSKLGLIKTDSSGNIIDIYPTSGSTLYYIPDVILFDSEENVYYRSECEYGSYSNNGVLRFSERKTIYLYTLSVNSMLVEGISNEYSNSFIFTLK